MFNKVILTFSTRILTAILSIVNVLIGTNFLGVEGYGTISLVILGITIYLMIQNLITGSSIVYFISKFNPSSILLLSYLWSIFSIILFIGVIFLSQYLGEIYHWSFEIVPMKYLWYNVLLASGYGLMAIHLNILLGRERIKSYNLIFLVQHLLATILLVIFFVILKKQSINYYLIALFISYFVAFLFAFIFTFNYIKSFRLPSFIEFKSMMKYGILGQSANVFQLINYRLVYYLIDVFAGRASLGLYSAATQISEGLWIFGKSISTVLFARISNSQDIDYAKKLSLRLLKFTASITIIPLIVLVFMPESFYVMLLGEDFHDVRTIIRLLALGTISLSASMILSQYFSGIGKIEMNTAGSGIGVVITVVLGLILIPQFGIKGAAMVNSFSYLSALIFLIYHFNKETPVRLHNWLLSWEDIIESWQLISTKIKRNKSNLR